MCSCVICLAAYAAGDELVTLPCFHSFHAECARTWLHQRPVCPMCKGNIEEMIASGNKAFAEESS